MITRKSIVAAFEIIANDKTFRTVSVFIGIDRIFREIERVRVTRVFKNKQEFRVMLGKCNYAEREFLKRASRQHKPLPKIMVSEWPKRKVNP